MMSFALRVVSHTFAFCFLAFGLVLLKIRNIYGVGGRGRASKCVWPGSRQPAAIKQPNWHWNYLVPIPWGCREMTTHRRI
jgi:hypothetical protein